MPVYYVNAEDYFRGHFDLSDDTEEGRWRNRDVILCQRAIRNLIDRYNLNGQAILSLGAGEGHEEYSFHSAGCTLTMNDVNPAFAPYLSRLLPVPPDGSNRLVYSNEDASDCLKRFADQRYDVLYVSSFHPDELRRERIQSEFAKNSDSTTAIRGVTWPSGTTPYLQVLVDAFQLVKPLGLIIFQHYRGGVNLRTNSHYFGRFRVFSGRSGFLVDQALSY